MPVTVRVTRRLLERMRDTFSEVKVEATTRLGDWHANVVQLGRSRWVLFVSERTLLPVVVAQTPIATLLDRFPDEVGRTLRALGVSAEAVERECAAMHPIAVAPTSNRRVLGTMNDFVRMMDVYDGVSSLEMSLDLAKAPCSPIGMESPDRLTVTLFASEPA